MDALTLFGLFAVTGTLVCYALEKRGPRWILGFAFACALSSVYGFLQGAWPFGRGRDLAGPPSRSIAGWQRERPAL